MLIVMKAQATEADVRAVCQKIESLGFRAHTIPGAQRTAIGITGNQAQGHHGGEYAGACQPGRYNSRNDQLLLQGGNHLLRQVEHSK